ncbi:SMP-30/gluconolactonase/LRE family protein [Gloeothece verrucosa]|uniref:SMP-30/gluconolactonase/LRE family protein n=1 Tax=Gloeothece verrucosa TaxID=2546359 RepID=UPI00017E2824|nr:SMP-30/gluconolactonase/LRE family protein [Gloeothece verrucosa]
MAIELELLIDTEATLGECPSGDNSEKRLYWVDIDSKRLHVYQPQQHQSRMIQLEEFVSCVVPRKSGGVVVGLPKILGLKPHPFTAAFILILAKTGKLC